MSSLEAGNRYQTVTLLSSDDGKRIKGMGEYATATKRIGGETVKFVADARLHLHKPMTAEGASSYFDTEAGRKHLELYEGVWGDVTSETRGEA